MTVAELIDYLEQHPKDMKIVYRCFSEQCMLEAEDISVADLCKARNDGWVHDKRPDKETETYLVLPGN